MRSAHCWGSAGRRWLRRMTGCTPVHGNIQNATAKAWRASSELGYRQNRHQIWCSWVSTGQAWFGCLIAVNLKFTGAIYSLIILFVMISMALARARLGRAEILALVVGVVLTISVSAPTYVRNALTYGHPFYPLNQIDVMNGQAPARFLEQNRWAKFVRATFLLPRGDFVDQHIRHYYTLVNRPDIRASVFGSLFGYS